MAKRSNENKREESLLRKINPKDKGSAVAIAKSKGLIKQSGKNLKLTAKGKKATSKRKKK